jgi:hypothetical protein
MQPGGKVDDRERWLGQICQAMGEGVEDFPRASIVRTALAHLAELPMGPLQKETLSRMQASASDLLTAGTDEEAMAARRAVLDAWQPLEACWESETGEMPSG